MMKKLLPLILVILACAVGAEAQVSSSTARQIVRRTATPATCPVGTVYTDISVSPAVVKVCLTNNTPTPLVSSAGEVSIEKLELSGLPTSANTAHAALTVTKPENPGGLVMSALDLRSESFAGGFLQRIFLPTSTDPAAYMNDAGHYYTRLTMTVSGSFENSGLETYRILPPSADDFNLGVWGDIDGPAMQVRATPYVLTQTRIADFLEGTTGNHVLSVRNNGALSWGVSNYAAQDTNLYRSAANTLKTDDNLFVTGNITTTAGTIEALSVGDPIVKISSVGAKSGLLRDGLTHFVFYDTNTGDTGVDAVFTGAGIKFLIEGTERARVTNVGNFQINSAGKGLVLKSPDGTVCKLVTIDDAGAIALATITCP